MKTSQERTAEITRYDMSRPFRDDPRFEANRVVSGARGIVDYSYLSTSEDIRGELVVPKQFGRIALSQNGFVIVLRGKKLLRAPELHFVEVESEIEQDEVARGVYLLANPSKEGVRRDSEASESVILYHARLQQARMHDMFEGRLAQPPPQVY